MSSYSPGTIFARVLVLLMGVLAAFGGVQLVRGHGAASSESGAAHLVFHYGNEHTADLLTLDPHNGPDFNARQAVQLIFSGLVKFGPHFRVVPDLAERWTVSRDNRTYTFFLRPNARFADGRYLSAADVAWSLQRALRPSFSSQSGSFLDNIDGATSVMSGKSTTLAGVQTLNSHTLRIRLAEPSGSFLSKLANPAAYVVPPWAVEKDPRHWADHAFGTGPFRVTRWIHKNALQLAPNRYFYGGKPKLDGIDMPFFPEPIAAFKRYQIGALHTMGAVRFPTQELYAVSGRADFHPSTRLETVYLTLNERRAPFNNSLVRKAFALAVNKQAIVDQAFGGFANPTDVMLPPGIPGYAQAAQRATYNPAFARKLLAKSGHAGGRGLPEIDYPVDQDAQDALMDSAIVQQWQRVLGVRVRLTKYTHTRYLLLLQKLQYQIAVIDWTADYPDPENFLSQQLHTGSPNNNGGWSNPAFDRLVDRADRMPVDRSERYTLYRRAEKIAMQEAAVIPLVNPKAGILLRRDVRGLVISGGYILSGNWAHVTVSPASTQ